MGLHRAWPDAEIIGVDNEPQKHYPFNFVLGDATKCLIDGFDFIWASPPCQDHMMTPHRKHGTGWMLAVTKARMNGTPWVIENVPGAPLRRDFVLCGCQFNSPHLRRKRIFETSGWGSAPEMSHDHSKIALSVVGHGTPSWVRGKWGRCPTIAEYRAAMGIDWMNRDELSQAVPPAYSEYIGNQYKLSVEGR